MILNSFLFSPKIFLMPPYCRNMEDFVTWVDSSAIKKHIMEYNEMVSFICLIFYILLMKYSYHFVFIIEG